MPTGAAIFRQWLTSEEDREWFSDIARIEPEIQVTDVDLKGNRRLILTHHVHDGQVLNKSDCDNVLLYLAQIWGYGVKLLEVDVESGRTLRKHTAVPLP